MTNSSTVRVQEAVNVHAMKVYGGVEVHLHPLSRTQDGRKWQKLDAPATLHLGKVSLVPTV